MPNTDGTVLDVVIYDSAGKKAVEFVGEDSPDYVSFIAYDTYGKPALIAPPATDSRGRTEARADVGDVVLFINTTLTPLVSISRRELTDAELES